MTSSSLFESRRRLPPRPGRSLRPYVVALAVLLGAVGLRLLLDPRMSAGVPPLTLLGSVALVAWLYGRGPALLAAILALPLNELVGPARDVLGAPLGIEQATGAFALLFVAYIVAEIRGQVLDREASSPSPTIPSASSVISHELRAPLQAMRSWLDVLGATSIDPATERAQKALRAAVERQSRLVEDLVDHARIERGQLRIERAPVDLRSVAEECVESLWAVARDRGIDLALEDSRGAGLRVLGDRRRLEQVVTVLLSNALRHTDAGGRIDVRLSAIEDEVRVDVRDTGVGIEPDHLADIFEPFVQNGGRRRRSEGLGLGLWIARRLVEAHGGTLTAESAGRGQGASFRVHLPRPEAVGVEKTTFA